jgi:3-oxoacyl-(acyl-carrier-protein) synthase
MTEETRAALAAASLVMRLLEWRAMENVGIISCEFSGWLSADERYFRDYIAQGRTLGRANHFIYTLPTSALSEVAIALRLNGPTLHLHGDDSPRRGMVEAAIAMVQNGEAAGMLCVCSEGPKTLCIAVGFGDELPGDYPAQL